MTTLLVNDCDCGNAICELREATQPEIDAACSHGKERVRQTEFNLGDNRERLARHLYYQSWRGSTFELDKIAQPVYYEEADDILKLLGIGEVLSGWVRR
jgi:hypothetical protein